MILWIILIIVATPILLFIYSYIQGTKRIGPYTINANEVEYRIRGEVNRILGKWMEIPTSERRKYFGWWWVFWIRFAPYIKDSDLYGR